MAAKKKRKRRKKALHVGFHVGQDLRNFIDKIKAKVRKVL